MTLAALATGCAAPAPPAVPAATSQPNPNLNPCADRLHDISGQLLLYYAAHKELPKRLEDLKASLPGQEVVPLVCPLSGQPYIYNPRGVAIAGLPGFVVVYDATPCHDGMRWAAMFEQTSTGRLMARDVVRLPESVLPPEARNPSSQPATRPAPRPTKTPKQTKSLGLR